MEVELGWNKDYKGTPYVQRMENSWNIWRKHICTIYIIILVNLHSEKKNIKKRKLTRSHFIHNPTSS